MEEQKKNEGVVEFGNRGAASRAEPSDLVEMVIVGSAPETPFVRQLAETIRKMPGVTRAVIVPSVEPGTITATITKTVPVDFIETKPVIDEVTPADEITEDADGTLRNAAGKEVDVDGELVDQPDPFITLDEAAKATAPEEQWAHATREDVKVAAEFVPQVLEELAKFGSSADREFGTIGGALVRALFPTATTELRIRTVRNTHGGAWFELAFINALTKTWTTRFQNDAPIALKVTDLRVMLAAISLRRTDGTDAFRLRCTFLPTLGEHRWYLSLPNTPDSAVERHGWWHTGDMLLLARSIRSVLERWDPLWEADPVSLVACRERNDSWSLRIEPSESVLEDQTRLASRSLGWMIAFLRAAVLRHSFGVDGGIVATAKTPNLRFVRHPVSERDPLNTARRALVGRTPHAITLRALDVFAYRFARRLGRLFRTYAVEHGSDDMLDKLKREFGEKGLRLHQQASYWMHALERLDGVQVRIDERPTDHAKGGKATPAPTLSSFLSPAEPEVVRDGVELDDRELGRAFAAWMMEAPSRMHDVRRMVCESADDLEVKSTERDAALRLMKVAFGNVFEHRVDDAKHALERLKHADHARSHFGLTRFRS